MLRGLLYTLLAIVALGIFVRVFRPLPPLEPRTHSVALTDTGDTMLGRGAAKALAGHDGLTGLYMLNDGRSAFAARMLLARAATRSLDVQYYIWTGDLAGSLLLNEMRAAADRGVRVRMLLDDNGIAGLDGPLAAIDRHPNVEVRLFNPFVIRRPKMLGYLFDFPRLNHRMHNKSFSADNQATIIGGRNVGDHYYAVNDEGLFADLDVLAIGPAVGEVSSQFDRYWSSASAYPADRILPDVPPERVAELRTAAVRAERDPQARAYLDAIRDLPLVEAMTAGKLPMVWAPVRLVSDDPIKALGRGGKAVTLWAALQRAIGKPERKLALVSGYFIPTAAGAGVFPRLARQGVDVSVLTNAFEATDVTLVHAGYAKRRKALLKAGIRLFELKAGSGENGLASKTPNLLGSGSGTGQSGKAPSSKSTLHAKTFAIDDARLFVGSFNFDPRSMNINTELGFLIESRELAGQLHGAFDAGIPQRAYEVIQTPEGELAWIERQGARVIRHDVEPGTTAFDRAATGFMAMLPIEWLL